MSDQCKTCCYRDDIKGCESVECTHHESWYVSVKQARIEALEKEQAAWQKFTDEANRTLDAADKRIASLVVEVELKDKEVRKWKEAWQQADDDMNDEVALRLAALLEGK